MGKKKYNPYLYENDNKTENEIIYDHRQTRIGFDYGHTPSYSRQHSYGYGSYDYYTNYNWGQYGNYSYMTDLTEDKLIVKKPTGYATPDKKDIEQKLRRIGHISTESNENLVADFARFYYYQLLEDPKYLKQEAFSVTKSAKTLNLANAISKVLTSKWPVFTEGNSPLDKAITLFAELGSQKPGEGESPITIDKLGEGELMISERVFKDAIYNDLLDKLDIDPSKKLSIMSKLSLIQDFGNEFKVEKETVDKLANNSRLTAQKIMRDYSQLHMVEAYQRLLPNYQAKLLTKNLVVKVHIDRVENKQKIIMLVDFSGSMSAPVKQEWVMALMIDRLKYVIQGEAEIFFSFFVCDPKCLRFSYLHDTVSAMAFWKTFSTHPNGGETDMGTIVSYVGDQIRSGKFHNLNVDLSQENPEILIVNDGNDSVHTDAFSYKTNALTLTRDNDELRDLCLKNDGRYVHVTNDSKVIYS